MKFDYDLFVIGAGPGGLAASERAAGYGIRVAIAEQDLVGGTCVIRGCIPEKLMSFAAEFSEESQVAAGYGWKEVQECSFDWQQFIDAKDKEIHRLSQVHTQKLQKAGVELINGYARFIDAHTLDIAGRQITADKILIAVGAKDVKPEIPGSEYIITSSQLFSLKQQPKHIAIIGGNYIPVKLTGIMNNLGCQVTQIFQEEHILSSFDQDIAQAVQEGMAKRGIQILGNTKVKEIQRVGDELDLMLSSETEKKLRVDTVLFALCRTPNMDSLGLENAGIHLNEGGIMVDEYNQTTQANIFAVGDCINRINFTPVAIAQGRAFADTQFGNNPRKVCYEYVPSTVSSHPEAATVGLSEAEARAKLGDDVRCYCSQFRPLLHSLTNRDEKTLIKLVVDNRSDRVLGAHMVGEGAIEIIHCLALALRVGATKKHFDEAIGIHPSIAEEFLTLR